MIQHPETITQHNYLTKMANSIIDDDTGKELNYHQLSKNTKHKKIRKESFVNELGRLSQGTGVRVDIKYTMLFIAQNQGPRDQIKDVTYGLIVVILLTTKRVTT